MLTRMFSAKSSAARPLLGSVVALALLGAPVTFDAAMGGGSEATTCVGSLTSFTCVRRFDETGDPSLRGPRDEREEAESAERYRQWVARCRPVVKQDRYGVGRYLYAAPGCEFGKFQD